MYICWMIAELLTYFNIFLDTVLRLSARCPMREVERGCVFPLTLAAPYDLSCRGPYGTISVFSPPILCFIFNQEENLSLLLLTEGYLMHREGNTKVIFNLTCTLYMLVVLPGKYRQF